MATAIAHDPFRAAKAREELPLDEALDEELKAAGWSIKERTKINAALMDPEGTQGEVQLDRETEAKVKGLEASCVPWQEWVRVRQIEEQKLAASTVRNWESKLKNLAEWWGSDQVGTMTKKDAHKYKLHLIARGLTGQTISNNIGTMSGFWNWAETSEQITTGNIWLGLKRGLDTRSKRKPLEPQQLEDAETKAMERRDIRFFFGRYQGLRKEDYCGLRWCDIDMTEGVMHLCQYRHKDKVRRLKRKEKRERTIPIHSKLLALIGEFLPDALTRNDEEPIWGKDYTPALHGWGCRYSEQFTWHYGFGTHDLRALVVTRMLKRNISPFYLQHITGHKVAGGDVLSGYVQPTTEEIREVLELLD